MFLLVLCIRNVMSSNTSCLEAHLGFFRLLMKGIIDLYVLWPFEKKLNSKLAMRVRTRDYTVCHLSEKPYIKSCMNGILASQQGSSRWWTSWLGIKLVQLDAGINHILHIWWNDITIIPRHIIISYKKNTVMQLYHSRPSFWL